MQRPADEPFIDIPPEQSLLEFLRFACERPSMYFEGRSARCLEKTLEGWNFALTHLKLHDSRFRAFQTWMDRTNKSGPVHALYWKIQDLGDEAAFDWYFDRFNEHLQAESESSDLKSKTASTAADPPGSPMAQRQEDKTPVPPDKSLMVFLGWVRDRPGMYLGEMSGRNLDGMISGWKFALAFLKLRDEEFERFEHWLAYDKYGNPQSSHALCRMVADLGVSESLDWFFACFDEYVALQNKSSD